MSSVEGQAGNTRVEFEDALDQIGVGRYSYQLLATCSVLLLAMYLDLFSLSVALPAAACDLALSTDQRALLSAVPLVGILVSSWWWGLASDLLGRRRTLLAAMTVGVSLNVLCGLAPGYTSLCLFKFFSAAFTASANAAGFVLVGEMTPRSHRNGFLFVMASVTMFTQLIIAGAALPILSLSFRTPVPWLSLELRPWRALLLLTSAPGVLAVLSLAFCRESSKFLLSRGAEEAALRDLRYIYLVNNGPGEEFTMSSVFLAESSKCPAEPASLLRRMWSQTAPLFTPPLLKHSLVVYYVLLSAYMTSTGFTMWVPTLTNMYFDGEDHDGQTFCDVVTGTATAASNITEDASCDHAVEPRALYGTMVYSGASGCVNLGMSLGVARAGRRRCTQLVFAACAACGALLYAVRTPLASLALFYGFLYVCLVLGAVNSYIVELYPTHLRGMATCVSVMVARGSGFLSVNTIARLLPAHCAATIGFFIALILSGGAVSFLLPPDQKKRTQESEKVLPS